MFLSYKNGRINYNDTGKGPVIVLLHGYPVSSEVWNGFADKLSSGFRVISMDLPGNGLSDVYGETHSMEFMATVLKDLLAGLQIDKVCLIGHSMGGYVTLAFLELFPEYLSGYCLFHSQPFSDSAETVEKRKLEIAMVKSGKKDIMYPPVVVKMFATPNLEKFSSALQRSMDIASRNPGEGLIAVLNGMMIRQSRLSLMEAGSVPCLWILGRMDNFFPCDAIRAKVRLPSNASLVVLENSGHLGFIEEEELSVKIVNDFMGNLI